MKNKARNENKIYSTYKLLLKKIRADADSHN